MKSGQQGFTLIELVVVITILSILTAVALPKFAALQADARIAKINGALAAMKAAASMVHSVVLTQGLPASTTVTLEGINVNVVNAYPKADSIALGAGVATPDFSVGAIVDVAGLKQIRISADIYHGNCAILYQEAAANGAPVFSIALDSGNLVDRANCS